MAPVRPIVRFRVICEGRSVKIGRGETVVGRDADAGVRIDCDTVSRRHARLLVTGDQVTIEDLGSKNGTFLRGERLDAPARVTDADEIRVGAVRLVFCSCAPLGAATSTELEP